jgi:hypothetical protein
VKVTNVSQKTIYLKDLKFVPQSQTEGRRGEDRYLRPGAHAYLPNTSEVLRSVVHGDIRAFVQQGILALEDHVTLANQGQPGDSVTLEHGFHYPPSVYLLKQVDDTWVDGTGTADVTHNAMFTATTVANVTDGEIVYMIRLI